MRGVRIGNVNKDGGHPPARLCLLLDQHYAFAPFAPFALHHPTLAHIPPSLRERTLPSTHTSHPPPSPLLILPALLETPTRCTISLKYAARGVNIQCTPLLPYDWYLLVLSRVYTIQFSTSKPHRPRLQRSTRLSSPILSRPAISAWAQDPRDSPSTSPVWHIATASKVHALGHRRSPPLPVRHPSPAPCHSLQHAIPPTRSAWIPLAPPQAPPTRREETAHPPVSAQGPSPSYSLVAPSQARAPSPSRGQPSVPKLLKT
ncbi:hypothetical protein B0H14DRAFT_3533307 [Mycena olivaceomarginata]|nr:hypothetical protein B0H14DRAFT_3533307 [Mycena olivaceomarginata]